jgi:type I restriction enzyme S subunit
MKDATFSSARLLELYDRISDSEDAISRLRRFVLDLAVRGKLVEQDARDEPAAELLKRFAQEKARLVKEGQIRKSKDFKRIEETPYLLPKSWVWVRLGEIGETQTGSTPPKSHPEFYGSDVPFLRPGDLYPTYVDYSGQGLSRAGAATSGRLAPSGSILMVCIGTIGKSQLIDRSSSFNQQINALTAFTDLVPTFLLRTIQSDFFQAAAWGASAKTTIAILNKGNWEQLPIPIPPLAEQHRIVDKVDELMALCDQLEQARAGREAVRDRLTTASLARLTAPETDADTFQSHAYFALQSLPTLTNRSDQIKTLRQTILNLAVRGKLVAQNAADEPAAELLRNLDQEIASYCEANRIRQTVGDPIGLDAEPEPVPSGWVWVRLCSLFKVITDGDHQAPPKADSGIAFLTIGNITTGELDFEGCRLVPESYYQSLAPYRTPTKGDILYTVVGATYGRPAIVEADRAFCVQRHIAILKPTLGMSLRYLAYLLSSPLVYDQATKGTTGTAQPTIALRPLRSFVVPLPPLAEQNRIVAKVDALMALCDQLEASLTATATTRSKLLNALLHEALAPATETAEA